MGSSFDLDIELAACGDYAGDDVLRAVVQRKFCIVGEIPP
jgi:hypothetical protein